MRNTGKGMLKYSMCIVVVVLAIFCQSAQADPPTAQAYFNDFDGGLLVAPGVTASLGGIVTTESVQGYAGFGTGGNIFGGDFLRNTTGGLPDIGVPGLPTTLTLTGLPPHTSIDINFLLAIIDSWDGTLQGEGCSFCSPDIFTVTVDGISVFSETFGFNSPTFIPSPGVLLVDWNEGMQLGFQEPDFFDAAFDMGLNPTFDNIPHTGNTLTIEWFASGDGWQGSSIEFDDESWAIENVEIVLNDLGLQVLIDIKPGSDPNCFDNDGHGVIPVAILGSADFHVTEIDDTTLLFDGLEVRIRGNKGPVCSVEDSNGDAFPDFVCLFEDEADNWAQGTTLATVTGELFDGTRFAGTDSICIVGQAGETVVETLYADGNVLCDGASDLSSPAGTVTLMPKTGGIDFRVKLTDAALNWLYYVEISQNDNCSDSVRFFGLTTDENGHGVLTGTYSTPPGDHLILVDVVSDPNTNVPPNPKHREIGPDASVIVTVP